MKLEFGMELKDKPAGKLLKGSLVLKKGNGDAGIKFEATSGCRGYQYGMSYELRGKGCLPPSNQLGKVSYSVSTSRLWLPYIKGVEGSFYAISPFEVKLVNGLTRGDFGIHFDANVPGSAGCIVLTNQEHWNLFRLKMQELKDIGFLQIPLEVKYYF